MAVELWEGPPADTILQVVEAHNCDLIVIGNWGHGRGRNLLLGCISHEMLTQAALTGLLAGAQKDRD